MPCSGTQYDSHLAPCAHQAARARNAEVELMRAEQRALRRLAVNLGLD
jgi:hypothetical protein